MNLLPFEALDEGDGAVTAHWNVTGEGQFIYKKWR